MYIYTHINIHSYLHICVYMYISRQLRLIHTYIYACIHKMNLNICISIRNIQTWIFSFVQTITTVRTYVD
jgi:hypothetical protein